MSVNVYDPVNDRLIPVAGATLYGDAPVGSIIAFAGKEINLPKDYLAFNGQTVKRGDYPDLWAFAVANEQVGVDKFFSQGDGSTTFTLADLRETSLKGYGETSRTVGNHVKSGGLGVGEFIDDRLQNHDHYISNVWTNQWWLKFPQSADGNFQYNSDNVTSGMSSGRSGATTEVKAVGVVWAVKAKQTGLPIDLKEQVEKYFDDLLTPTLLGSCTVGEGSVGYGNAKRLLFTVSDISGNLFYKEVSLSILSSDTYINMGGNERGDILLQVRPTSGNKDVLLYRATTGSASGGTLKVYKIA